MISESFQKLPVEIVSIIVSYVRPIYPYIRELTIKMSPARWPTDDRYQCTSCHTPLIADLLSCWRCDYLNYVLRRGYNCVCKYCNNVGRHVTLGFCETCVNKLTRDPFLTAS